MFVLLFFYFILFFCCSILKVRKEKKADEKANTILCNMKASLLPTSNELNSSDCDACYISENFLFHVKTTEETKKSEEMKLEINFQSFVSNIQERLTNY